MIAEALLLVSLAMLAYIYVGYPAAVWLIGWARPRPPATGSALPTVTVITAAHNEAEQIQQTVQNKLESDYPPDRLRIVVVSDASDDGTDELVAQMSSERVQLLRQEPRAGKTAALNLAVSQVSSEVIVFADANSIYASDAMRQLVRPFTDPEVGYVTGNMRYVIDDASGVATGCGAYMRYENMIRRAESRLGSVVGVDGGIDAVRRDLYQRMHDDQLPDFVLPLRVVMQGHRVVHVPEAELSERANVEPGSEYRMRVRVSLRALWALWEHRHLLNPIRYGVFSWQLLSHKVLRYFGFLFLCVALVANAVLVGQGVVWELLLAVQGICYMAAVAGSLGLRIRLFHLAYYFVLINTAAAHAFLRFALGKKQVMWSPRQG